jgi:hypothetical protein
MNHELDVDSSGNINVKPVTSWNTLHAANSAVILVVGYLDLKGNEAQTAVANSIQLALTPPQCEDLSAALSKAAKTAVTPDG